MVCGIYSSTRCRTVGPTYRCTLCGSGDGLASFDGSMDDLGSAGRLGQTAFFLVIQDLEPPIVNSGIYCYNVAGDDTTMSQYDQPVRVPLTAE